MTADVIPLGPARDAADQARLRHETGFWLLLPLPPSVNSMYRNVRGRGRVKTARYDAWIDTAGKLLNNQETAVYDQPVTVHIDVRLKDKRVRDLDNLLKPLLDLIGPKGHRLIKDDSVQILQALSIRVCPEAADFDCAFDNALTKGWCRMVVKPVAKPEEGRT